nr:phosphotransferase [uncultured Cohaesibacter sp.]
MTVLTELSEQDCNEIAEAFNLGDLHSIIGIVEGDVETTYLFRTSKDQVIVTLFESAVTSLDLERAFKIMERLHVADIPCPKPMLTADGQPTINIRGKIVAVVSYVNGVTNCQLNGERGKELGRIAAKIHTLLSSQAVFETTDLRRGCIHGALTPGNVLFLQNRISGLINFRQVHQGYLVRELADLFAKWALRPDGKLSETLFESILAGYESVCPLNSAEKESLPGFVMSCVAEQATILKFQDILELANSAFTQIQSSNSCRSG